MEYAQKTSRILKRPAPAVWHVFVTETDGRANGLRWEANGQSGEVKLSELDPELIEWAAIIAIKRKLADAIAYGATPMHTNHIGAQEAVAALKDGRWNRPKDARGLRRKAAGIV